MNYIIRFLIIGLLIAAIVLLNYSGLFDHITLTTVRERAQDLHHYVSQHFFTSLVLFCLLFIGATITMLPVTVILTIVAGFLFGPSIGTSIVIVSATTGGALIFLFVRYFLGTLIQHRFHNQLKRFNQEIKRYGAYYLLMLQILPITPTIIINLFAGLSPISLGTYMWTTAVGIMPGTLIYTLAGQQLHKIQEGQSIMTWQIGLLLFLLAILVLVPMFIKRWHK